MTGLFQIFDRYKVLSRSKSTQKKVTSSNGEYFSNTVSSFPSAIVLNLKHKSVFDTIVLDIVAACLRCDLSVYMCPNLTCDIGRGTSSRSRP